MARKRTSRKEDRRSSRSEGQQVQRLARRVGSWLTLLVVSVITVLLGFAIGRYVIVNLISDTLGLDATAQTAQTPRTSAAGTSQNTPVSGTTAGQLESGTTAQASSGTSTAATLSSTHNEPTEAPNATSTQQGASSGGAGAPQQSQSSASGGATGESTPNSTVVGSSAQTATPQSTEPSSTQVTSDMLYRVQVGGSTSRGPADELLAALKGTFPDAFVSFGSDFRVQVGAYSSLSGAQEVVDQLAAMGYTEVHVIPVNR